LAFHAPQRYGRDVKDESVEVVAGQFAGAQAEGE
jgi:hypothetical protein